MKNLNEILIEKLTISSKTKVNKKDYLDPEDIKDIETPGKDYFGEDVVIIGLPFKNKNDKNYKTTKEYIKNMSVDGYSIYNDLEDIDNLNEYDKDTYFAYACHKGDKEINCYVYGPEGIYAENE